MSADLIGQKAYIRDSGSQKQYKIVGVASHDAYRVHLSFDGAVLPTSFAVERLEIIEEKADPQTRANKFGVNLDACRVDHDEATELCAHMLGLAHMYFQATPDDARDEVIRILAKREGPELDGAVMVGALAAFDAWHAYYERLKLDD